jgi:5'-nucleotidase (lipoprotein e(P4) family)
MSIKNYLLGSGFVLTSFLSIYFAVASGAQTAVQAVPAHSYDYQIGATLYQQKSGEYRALAYQAYNLARLRLDEDLDKKNVKKLPKPERKRPRAIVVDIDETILDNSPANALGAKNNLPFNVKDWYAWGEMRKAKPVPGAVDFLNYAVSKGVKIFFISNRDEPQKQATIDNLKSAGFSDVSADNVWLRQVVTVSTKEPRRTAVADKYRIVLFMGDNLDDFSDMFEAKSTAERFAAVEKNRDLFGKRFIVLPNAMYGTWENAIYEYKRGLTETQKAEIRTNALVLP